jgi:hypothetical protein
MGFSSFDQIVDQTTNQNKTFRYDWMKLTGASAFTAGRWYDLTLFPGMPANAIGGFTGTTGAWQSTNASSNIGIPNGGDVSPNTKHILNASAVSGVATGVPGQLLLCDLQGYVICNNFLSTLQTFSGGGPVLRGPSEGLRLYLVANTAMGATAQLINSGALVYTNTTNNITKTNPVNVTCTTSGIVGHILHSQGTTANSAYGPFIPLAQGDTGVANAISIQFSAGGGTATSTSALCLVRPLALIPITTQYIPGERDFVNQLPSLPRVYDDACLIWLYYAGAATVASTAFNGHVDFAWG